jgi:uncharacterized iron-regulated protein
LSKDLRDIVDTFGGENFDPDQLEAIVEYEQQRSKNILQLAGYLDNQVNKLFLVVNSIFYHIKQGNKVPIDVQKSVSTRFSVVQETIDSMTKVASSSPRQMRQVMEQAEKDIAIANDEVINIDLHAYDLPHMEPMDPETIPPPIKESSNESCGDLSLTESVDSEDRSLWNEHPAPVVEIMKAEKPPMIDAEVQTDEIVEYDVQTPEKEEEVAEIPEFDPPWGTFDSAREDTPTSPTVPESSRYLVKFIFFFFFNFL